MDKLEKIIDLKLDASDRDAERHGLIQYDYGQILRIHGLDLPPAVEIQFSYREKGGVTENRIGTTKDGVTEVRIPDAMLKNNGTTQDYAIWVFIYVTDATSGNTVYRIKLYVDSRPAPGEKISEDPDEPHILDEAVNAVNAAADRAETAEAEARSAADSATAAAESAKKSAEEVVQEKNTAISAIQNQQVAAEKAITDHTDTEIGRLDRETQESEDRLTETIRTANDTKEAAENTISEARRVKESLDISVQNATKEKEAVEASTSTANAAKKNLDQSTADANVAKTALDKTIQSADDQNTSLGEKIETSKQLKTDLQTAGEKATQDIQTAGSEQLGKMQAVAEEFTADREQITTNKEDIGSLKEDTDVLQKRQNVLVGSEAGNPVSCDDAFAAPLCGLNVYGRSTQDGTPSPDNPVPIVSAGDGGSVAVKVTGANILEGTKPGVKSTTLGVTFTSGENGILITGVSISTSSKDLHKDNISRLPRGIYYLTTKGLSASVVLNFFYVGKITSDQQNRKVFLTKDVDYSLVLQVQKSETPNTIVQISLTRAPITAYSPYREQLLTLPTPSGLPGIPATSGGNYTDENGQQWVCDEVDLERGVKVQRVESRRILSSEVKDTILGANSCYIIERNMTRPANNQQIYHIMCTHLECASWSSVVDNGVQGICVISNQPYIGISIQGFKSANEYKDFIDKNEVGIAYELATPIETPLTPAEIAAYKALTAYAPDTVVQASDGAGIKLCYQRDVNLVVKNLEDAIASMTTT